LYHFFRNKQPLWYNSHIKKRISGGINFMTERPVSPEAQSDEEQLNQSLRPTNWDGYFGQSLVKENIQILIEAAKQRGDSLDHVLVYGPPGLGKTTLAGIIAQEMEASLKITSGPAIERPGDLAAVLTNLRKSDILFIDEIHRMSRAVEEVLYPAMEDFALDIMIGKGTGARSIRLKLPRFTILGATTRLAPVGADGPTIGERAAILVGP
jgi:Holliday junction DNA helicase RuvB